jgi:hypothetical protein
MPEKLMMTVTLEPDRATVEEARHRLGLEEDEVDANYIENIDPERHEYVILVDEQAAERIGGQPGVTGPFANPPIEPFGPPGVER